MFNTYITWSSFIILGACVSFLLGRVIDYKYIYFTCIMSNIKWLILIIDTQTRRVLAAHSLWFETPFIMYANLASVIPVCCDEPVPTLVYTNLFYMHDIWGHLAVIWLQCIVFLVLYIICTIIINLSISFQYIEHTLYEDELFFFRQRINWSCSSFLVLFQARLKPVSLLPFINT